MSTQPFKKGQSGKSNKANTINNIPISVQSSNITTDLQNDFSLPQPGPDNKTKYGPPTEAEWNEKMRLKREASIMNKYASSITADIAKIVIEEEEEQNRFGGPLSVIRSFGSSDPGSVIRIEEDPEPGPSQGSNRAYQKVPKDQKADFISNNKLIYLFKEEAYKMHYEDLTPLPRTGFNDLPNPMFSELLFFRDDFSEENLRLVVHHNCQYYRHQHSLNMLYYSEAFILHFLQIGVLGPFVHILALFYWPYCQFFQNLEFAGCYSSVIINFLFWATTWLCVLGHYWWGYDSIDKGYLSLFLVCLVSRSSIIAAKYATFTPMYRRRYMNRALGYRERRCWLMVTYWTNCEPLFTEEQIQLSIRRKYIDKSTFKINFFDFCSPELHAALKHPPESGRFQRMRVCSEHREFSTFAGVWFYYDGKSVFYQMVMEHYNNRQSVFMMPLFLLISAVWTCFPGVARLEAGLDFWGGNWLEKLLFFWGMGVLTFFFLISTLFFRIAWMDYDRISFMLRQLSQMYSPTKLPHIRQKMFPTMNLVDAVSLQAWINLRKLVLDYGVNFHHRHKIYIPMCFTIGAVSGFIVIFAEQMFPNFDRNELFRFQCPLAMTYVAFGLKFVMLMRKCQEINKNAKFHVHLIKTVQNVYIDLLHFKEYYIGEERRFGRRELPYEVSKVFFTPTRSRVHEWLNFKLKMMLGVNYKGCNAYLKKLVDLQKEIIKTVLYENEHYPKTFLGFRVSTAVYGVTVVGYLVIGVVGYFASFYLRFDETYLVGLNSR